MRRGVENLGGVTTSKILIKKERFIYYSLLINIKSKMKIKCTKEDCGYVWDYKGESKFYVTCPRCYRKLNIRKLYLKEKKKHEK